jgi:hypothetical protein
LAVVRVAEARKDTRLSPFRPIAATASRRTF